VMVSAIAKSSHGTIKCDDDCNVHLFLALVAGLSLLNCAA
jgi:hypothetical protein